jgi:hypothetical protein
MTTIREVVVKVNVEAGSVSLNAVQDHIQACVDAAQKQLSDIGSFQNTSSFPGPVVGGLNFGGGRPRRRGVMQLTHPGGDNTVSESDERMMRGEAVSMFERQDRIASLHTTRDAMKRGDETAKAQAKGAKEAADATEAANQSMIKLSKGLAQVAASASSTNAELVRSIVVIEGLANAAGGSKAGVIASIGAQIVQIGADVANIFNDAYLREEEIRHVRSRNVAATQSMMSRHAEAQYSIELQRHMTMAMQHPTLETERYVPWAMKQRISYAAMKSSLNSDGGSSPETRGHLRHTLEIEQSGIDEMTQQEGHIRGLLEKKSLLDATPQNWDERRAGVIEKHKKEREEIKRRIKEIHDMPDTGALGNLAAWTSSTAVGAYKGVVDTGPQALRSPLQTLRLGQEKEKAAKSHLDEERELNKIEEEKKSYLEQQARLHEDILNKLNNEHKTGIQIKQNFADNVRSLKDAKDSMLAHIGGMAPGQQLQAMNALKLNKQLAQAFKDRDAGKMVPIPGAAARNAAKKAAADKEARLAKVAAENAAARPKKEMPNERSARLDKIKSDATAKRKAQENERLDRNAIAKFKKAEKTFTRAQYLAIDRNSAAMNKKGASIHEKVEAAQKLFPEAFAVKNRTPADIMNKSKANARAKKERVGEHEKEQASAEAITPKPIEYEPEMQLTPRPYVAPFQKERIQAAGGSDELRRLNIEEAKEKGAEDLIPEEHDKAIEDAKAKEKSGGAFIDSLTAAAEKLAPEIAKRNEKIAGQIVEVFSKLFGGMAAIDKALQRVEQQKIDTDTSVIMRQNQ